MPTQFQPVPLQPAPSAAHPPTDYPAAHSMDTLWFAVDENGEIGRFDTGGRGTAPMLEGMEPVRIEDKTRSHHSKAHDYEEQYREIEEALYEQGLMTGEEDLDEAYPKAVHAYEPDDESNSLYYWRSSPERPITIHDLAEHLRNGKYLLELKDYDFASREPIDPYDYAAGGYNGWTEDRTYPDSYFQTAFPVNGPWDVALYLEPCKASGAYRLFSEGERSGQSFFAVDDDGFLAIFSTGRFGAMPLGKISVDKDKDLGIATSTVSLDDWQIWIKMLQAGPTAFPLPYRIDQLGEGLSIEEIYNPQYGNWRRSGPILLLLDRDYPITETGSRYLEIADGILTFSDRDAVRQGFARRAWLGGWAGHWLEYPFGVACPRLFGLYHYDVSWHHPIPYLRIGAPVEPVRFEQFSEYWRGLMQPVHLPGVRFRDAARVQPFEHIECNAADGGHYDGPFLSASGNVWVDARLEKTYPCPGQAMPFLGDPELLLRRARRHIRRIEGLWKS